MCRSTAGSAHIVTVKSYRLQRRLILGSVVVRLLKVWTYTSRSNGRLSPLVLRPLNLRASALWRPLVWTGGTRSLIGPPTAPQRRTPQAQSRLALWRHHLAPDDLESTFTLCNLITCSCKTVLTVNFPLKDPHWRSSTGQTGSY